LAVGRGAVVLWDRMKSPLVRLGLLLAVVALAALWWQFGDDRRSREREEQASAEPEENRQEPPTGRFGTPAKTKTPLDRHRWLRELERTIQEGSRQGALKARQKLAETLDEIEQDKELSGNLLELIREEGFGSDEPWKRDVLIPILRAMKHPEATELIRNGYYDARNDSEKRVLLEAMARKHHDPEQASVWAVDVALNHDDPEMREFAFTAIELHAGDEDIVARTAMAVFEASTRRKQAQWMLHEAARRAMASPSAMKFVRERLRNPRSEELGTLLQTIEGWGTEKDAAWLEALAAEFPEHSFGLREQAIAIRQMLQDPNAEKERQELAREREEHEKHMEREREEQARREKEAAERLANRSAQANRTDEPDKDG